MSYNVKDLNYRIYRALRDFAERDQPFTAAELRGKLGYSQNSAEARRMHAIIQHRKKDGIISVVSQGRKRNQHLRIELERKGDLQRLAENAFNSKGISTSYPADGIASTSGTPKRVLYLEERVENLEKAEAARDDKLDALVAELAELKQEVHQLVELWS